MNGFVTSLRFESNFTSRKFFIIIIIIIKTTGWYCVKKHMQSEIENNQFYLFEKIA